MEMNNLVTLFVNNGVAVAVIIYFMIRDIKFMQDLNTKIQELIDSVRNLEKTYKSRKEEEE